MYCSNMHTLIYSVDCQIELYIGVDRKKLEFRHLLCNYADASCTEFHVAVHGMRGVSDSLGLYISNKRLRRMRLSCICTLGSWFTPVLV